MTTLTAVLITLLILVAIVDKFLQLHLKGIRGRLEEKWTAARHEREEWERKYSCGTFTFNNEEYQRLWDMEIGAEMVYIERIQPFHVTTTSWYEYLNKKRESELGRTE